MRKPAGGARLSFIRPMEPELVEQPPRGDEWSHDQIRRLPHPNGQGCRWHPALHQDRRRPLKYRPLAEETRALDAESFIIEGEVIIPNEAGLSTFRALRSAITRRPQDLI